QGGSRGGTARHRHGHRRGWSRLGTGRAVGGAPRPGILGSATPNRARRPGYPPVPGRGPDDARRDRPRRVGPRRVPGSFPPPPGRGGPKARLVDMDEDGIDVAVLYGTLALGLWSIRDLDLQVACCRAFSDWLADYCTTDPLRLRAAAASMEASGNAEEAERAVTDLG